MKAHGIDFQAVIFDLDGTLYESPKIYVNVLLSSLLDYKKFAAVRKVRQFIIGKEKYKVKYST